MNNFQNPYQMSPRNGIIWCNGLEGAKAYQLMPNSNAILLDSENDGRFYIKVSDNVGMCNLRTFKYEEVIEQPKVENDYVTHTELADAIRELKGVIENGKQSIQPTKQK